MLKSTVKVTPTLQPQRPIYQGEAPADKAHIAFAIVLLGTIAMFAGGLLWFLLR
jgi:hypothetical protein